MSLTLKIQAKRPVRWINSLFKEYPSHRDNLGRWLNDNKLICSMVEIGCNDGAFAKKVLTQWEGSEYLMVDPWEEQPRTIFREAQGYKYQTSYEKCSKMAEVDNRIEIIRKFSADASESVEDDSMSCVYIDGNHAYESVLQDLELWWPKVQKGGIFGGHDYYNYTKNGHWCEVKRALDEWTRKMKLQFHVTPCTSWWIIK